METERGKNKNIFLRLGSALFFLTLVSVWSLSGIFARYCKIGSDENEAHVASFDVAAVGEEYNGPGGLTADYKITVENKSETAVKYDIAVTVSSDFPEEASVKLGEISPTENGGVYTFSNVGDLDVNSKAEKILTLSVDENSVLEENGKYSAECPFDIEVIFTQID